MPKRAAIYPKPSRNRALCLEALEIAVPAMEEARKRISRGWKPNIPDEQGRGL